jgi:hypothetical protein
VRRLLALRVDALLRLPSCRDGILKADLRVMANVEGLLVRVEMVERGEIAATRVWEGAITGARRTRTCHLEVN